MATLSIYKCTGTGYERGWWTNFKGRYRVFKGARNTKKSVDIDGYEVLDKILSDPRRNILIIRRTAKSLKNSAFALLKRLTMRPSFTDASISLSRYFSINKTDMTITYLPTGQVILFCGLDDPQKLQSITVVHGYLTDVYLAYDERLLIQRCYHLRTEPCSNAQHGQETASP